MSEAHCGHTSLHKYVITCLNVMTCYDILKHYYLISFVKGLFPRVSEAHCWYTSLHKYVITIFIWIEARHHKMYIFCQYRKPVV